MTTSRLDDATLRTWSTYNDAAQPNHIQIAAMAAELLVYREKDGLRTREHNILVQENRALQARVVALEDAWADSWDCSRDPGHRIMNAAIDAE
jgi:hypothetical protein